MTSLQEHLKYEFEVIRMKRIIRQWLPSLLLAIVVSLLIRTYVVEAMIVPSGSMIPTLKIHDRVVVEKVMPLTVLHHGDIIVFYPPVEDGEYTRFVKRLIGLPGDKIEIKDGILYRNSEKLDEPYVKEPMNYSYGPIEVPDNNYFFLGDNRNASFDSHLWETPFVEKNELLGKVIMTIPTHLLFK
jgi:signal peptidase I